MKKTLKWIVTPLILIAAIILLSSSMVTTTAKEYKLVTQFGKVVRISSEPGLSFKIPFIQEVQSVPKYKMISDLVPSDVTTKDKKVMTVDSFVLWDIADPLKYLTTLNASKENAEVRISNVVYNSIKNVLAATNQEDIITGRDGKLALTITENIGNALDSYGIRILSLIHI